MNKNELRIIMKEKRHKLLSEEIAQKSSIISDRLFAMPEFRAAKTVMVYCSSFNEVRTDRIISVLFEQNKRVVLPISNTDTETLTLSYLAAENALKKGAYGIYEPETIKETSYDDIDLVLVPGIVFDCNCRRIGFGKGYYDKLLCDMRAFKAGLCYDFQLIENINADSHDVALDAVITEERIIRNAV